MKLGRPQKHRDECSATLRIVKQETQVWLGGAISND